MASAEQVKIGDRTFEFGILPASKALRVVGTLAPAVAEGIVEFVQAFGEKDKAKQDQMVMRGVVAIISRMSAEDWTSPDGRRMLGVESLAVMLFDHASCGGKKIQIDATFQGCVKDLYVAVFHALRVNFSDFFPAGLSPSSPAPSNA
jgi:hypothetical protein